MGNHTEDEALMHGARPLRSTRRLQNLQQTLPRWYSITNSAAAGQPTLISIYDEIGFMGVSAGQFLSDLSAVKGDIECHINSPGGDIFDGIAIYNQLKARPGNVKMVVDGLAASAASFIAQAASPGMLEVAPHATVMIHEGFAMCIGNSADLLETAALLDKASENIAGIYADRTGKPAAYWREQMKAETWYSDQECVAVGLADKISGSDGPADGWDLSVYAKAPGPGSGADVNRAPGPDGAALPNADGTHAAADTAGVQLVNANGGWQQRDGKWVFDPDNDGDDDSTAAGDTDHDYWSADGKQLKPIPPDPAGKQGKPLTPGQKGNTAQTPLSAQFPALMVAVDNSDWDAGKAWSAGADADDPATFYAAICAGRKAGDPDTQAAWALPYKYTPSSAPNADGVKNALARLSQTRGLTNADEAKTKLQGLMKQINPDYEVDSNRLDPVLLRSMIAMPAARVDESPWDPAVALEAAAASDDPAAYFEAICAGHCPGSPQAKEAWALPYRYSPVSAPNAAGVRQALARLNQTKHLTNSVQARETLENAMRQVSTSIDPDDDIDPDLLGAVFAIGLEGSHRS